jgi:ribosomal protein L37AE/L43A
MNFFNLVLISRTFIGYWEAKQCGSSFAKSGSTAVVAVASQLLLQFCLCFLFSKGRSK